MKAGVIQPATGSGAPQHRPSAAKTWLKAIELTSRIEAEPRRLFADVVEEWAQRQPGRFALLSGGQSFTYGELDRMSDNLALNLLEIGFHPLDRVVVQLPNVAEFVILYLALQKIGGIPIAALMPHRYAEISQFVDLSGASACAIPLINTVFGAAG